MDNQFDPLSISDLPVETLEHILRFCEGYSYLTSQVCPSWRKVVLAWGNLKEKFIDMCFEEGWPCVARFPGSYFTITRLHSLVKNENIDLLRAAHRRGASVFICQSFAADVGSLKVLQWYKKEVGKLPSCSVGKLAASRGHRKVIDWLIEKHFYLGSEVMAGAAEFGDLEMVQKLKENGCEWGEVVCESAAEKGHLEILKWLRSNPEDLCPWNEGTSRKAAQSGDLETLRWLKEQNCPWNSNVSLILTMCGHFETLKWEVDNGGEWDAKMFGWIAEKGNIEVLQWAREKGYPHNNSFTASAASHGQLEVLKWAVREEFLLAPKCIELAIFHGDFETIRWLRKQGQPWPQKNSLPLLRRVKDEVRIWAIENGCPESFFELKLMEDFDWEFN